MSLSFDVRGHGKRTLVLLHGFTGSRDTFSHLQPALAAHFRLVRLDLPGHGASPPPSTTGAHGFEASLRLLEQTLEEAGCESELDLLGYSQGARLALALALRIGPRLRRLVLESGTAGLREPAEREARRRADEALAESIERDGVARFVAQWERHPLFEGVRRLPPATQDALRARRLAHSAAGLAAALRAMGTGVQPDLWPSLKTLRRPVLLLTGARDEKFTSLARAMAAELPDARHTLVEECWHAPHLEAPEAWLRAVTWFLQHAPFETTAAHSGSDNRSTP